MQMEILILELEMALYINNSFKYLSVDRAEYENITSLRCDAKDKPTTYVLCSNNRDAMGMFM
jgi:hypothetical protein